MRDPASLHEQSAIMQNVSPVPSTGEEFTDHPLIEGSRPRHGAGRRRQCFRGSGNERGEAFVQLVSLDGLGHVRVHASGQGSVDISLCGAGGEGDNRDVTSSRLATAYVNRCIVTIHNRHLAVHQDGHVMALLMLPQLLRDH